jgi:L-ascorbate metabolism protein UlaG (beta-lactamase superfamily)
MTRWHNAMMGLGTAGALATLGACAWLEQPKFGALPEGERLERIRRSPHYVDGAFRNLVDTPTLVDGHNLFTILAGNLRQRVPRLRPDGPIPSVKTDLHALDVDHDVVVWLGHSGYFIVLGGRRILIDPVFSPSAAPVSFSNGAFDGSTPYTAEDVPPVDVLLITHDHWDHLDHATVTSLAPKVGSVVVPIGVGAHFERWGYPWAKVRELDWFDRVDLDGALTIHAVPARHYSGRWFQRNQSLWAGFVLESVRRRLLFSGDTGAGPHFGEIARRFPEFDLVALDMGQYDARWPHIHMNPEQAADAARTLGAQALLPGHVGRFSMARHPWDEPFERIVAASADRSYRLLTPRIGEPVGFVGGERPTVSWWQNDARSAAPSVSMAAEIR